MRKLRKSLLSACLIGSLWKWIRFLPGVFCPWSFECPFNAEFMRLCSEEASWCTSALPHAEGSQLVRRAQPRARVRSMKAVKSCLKNTMCDCKAQWGNTSCCLRSLIDVVLISALSTFRGRQESKENRFQVSTNIRLLQLKMKYIYIYFERMRHIYIYIYIGNE